MSTHAPAFEPSRLRVVATGFGPFLENRRNPSWNVAQAFAEAVAPQFPTQCERLTVTYDEAQRFVESIDWEAGNLLVVHFGLSAKRDRVALERFAHNCRGATRDETGREGWSDYVAAEGPVAHATRLSVRTLASDLDLELARELDLGAYVSRDAGEYVCNAIYYHSLAAVDVARRAGLAADALFVHVPRLDDRQAEVVGARLGHCLCSHLAGSLT